jgi:hypothetical protein
MKNVLIGISIGAFLVSVFCGVAALVVAYGMEYRIIKAEKTAEEAKKLATDVRERLILPTIIPAEVVNGKK